jgi:hypothetical protein
MNILKQTGKFGIPMTLTNKQFLDIFYTLQETRSVKGVRYAMIVIKNSEVIAEHLKELDEMSKPSEEFIQLSLKAQELIKAQDAEGLEKLEAENAEVVEARKSQMDAINARMEETATLELKLIPEAILPQDITAEQIEKLMPIIQ